MDEILPVHNRHAYTVRLRRASLCPPFPPGFNVALTAPRARSTPQIFCQSTLKSGGGGDDEALYEECVREASPVFSVVIHWQNFVHQPSPPSRISGCTYIFYAMSISVPCCKTSTALVAACLVCSDRLTVLYLVSCDHGCIIFALHGHREGLLASFAGPREDTQ